MFLISTLDICYHIHKKHDVVQHYALFSPPPIQDGGMHKPCGQFFGLL